MDIDNIDGFSLKNLNKINIILGKNGCGKSSLLRALNNKRNDINNVGRVKYVNPERGGSLVTEPGIEQNVIQDSAWVTNSRTANQQSQFRQQSAAQYRALKDIVLEELEQAVKNGSSTAGLNFDIYIDKINTLLDEIEIKRVKSSFKIYKKGSTTEINATSISSGEAELISLGIEALTFAKEVNPTKVNLLLLDEPDVHLHPDLQVKLMHFLKKLVQSNDFQILIATHSTPILGALENYTDTHIEFMVAGQNTLTFEPISDIYKRILPVFGAHPLSNLFNEAPVFLVEGEDDERIWQQAVRTSKGKIKIYPCVCGNVTKITEYEVGVKNVTKAVYNNAKAYSLRDGDGATGDIPDEPPITKFRLQCYAAENLLLTDEVLTSLSIDWAGLKSKIDEWINEKKEKNTHTMIIWLTSKPMDMIEKAINSKILETT